VARRVSRLALLSGEHPTLPAAELRALLDVHAPAASLATDGLVARIDGADDAAVDRALARAALVHEWMQPWADVPDTPDGLLEAAQAVRARTDGRGSAAVVTERRGQGKSPHSLAVERALGHALADAGHRIDLRQPDCVVAAWLLAGRVLVGLRQGLADRARFDARASDERSHFSPVSLHPRRAASLLHLARVAPGGRVYDPFCGTGAFVLEAALEGYAALASDLDPFMVQGTLQTVTDVPPAPLDCDAFVADIGDTPGLLGEAAVDGIVTDLPYGRASGTDGEGVAALYPRALAAIALLLKPEAHAVVGHPDPSLLEGVEALGLTVTERHAERAHRSLTRHFAVLKRLPGVERPA